MGGRAELAPAHGFHLSSGRSPRGRSCIQVLSRPKSSFPSARRRRLARPGASGVPTGSMPISPAISGTRGEGPCCSIRLPLNSRSKSSVRRDLHLDVAANTPAAFVAVTLSEVLPDGAATRISYGLLNLTHRDGHEELKPLEPGRRYKVRIQLNECGQRIGAGNRLRLAISSAYWPIVWPSPGRQRFPSPQGRAHLSSRCAWQKAIRRWRISVRPRVLLRCGQGSAAGGTQDRDPQGRAHHRTHGGALAGRRPRSYRGFRLGLPHRGAAFLLDQTGRSASAEARTHWQKEYGRGDFRHRTSRRARI